MSMSKKKAAAAADMAPPAAVVDDVTRALGFKAIEVTHVRAEELSAADLERLEKFQPLFGTSEWVDVRQILPSRIGQYARSLGEEARAIELYCQREEGWADTLTIESVNAIADTGIEINGPFYRAWCLRQVTLREMQTPGEITKLRETLQKTIAQLQSGNSASETSIAK